MANAPDCTLLYGHMRDACIAANKSAGYDPHGKPIPGQAPTGGGGVLSGFTDITSAVTGFVNDVTDYTLWRSLGWLLLGALLVGAGLLLWNRSR